MVKCNDLELCFSSRHVHDDVKKTSWMNKIAANKPQTVGFDRNRICLSLNNPAYQSTSFVVRIPAGCLEPLEALLSNKLVPQYLGQRWCTNFRVKHDRITAQLTKQWLRYTQLRSQLHVHRHAATCRWKLKQKCQESLQLEAKFSKTLFILPLDNQSIQQIFDRYLSIC